jgi:transposase
VIASLIETCESIGVEPYRYFADVNTRIANGHPQSRLDELLP